MKVLAHFRPVKKDRENKLNSREGKLRFAFKMYDTDNDDLISKEELLGVLSTDSPFLHIHSLSM